MNDLELANSYLQEAALKLVNGIAVDVVAQASRAQALAIPNLPDCDPEVVLRRMVADIYQRACGRIWPGEQPNERRRAVRFLDSALESIQPLVERQPHNSDLFRAAEINYRRSAILREIGDLAEALDSAEASLSYVEKIRPEVEGEVLRLQGTALLLKGDLLERLDLWPEGYAVAMEGIQVLTTLAQAGDDAARSNLAGARMRLIKTLLKHGETVADSVRVTGLSKADLRVFEAMTEPDLVEEGRAFSACARMLLARAAIEEAVAE